MKVEGQWAERGRSPEPLGFVMIGNPPNSLYSRAPLFFIENKKRVLEGYAGQLCLRGVELFLDAVGGGEIGVRKNNHRTLEQRG